MQHNPNMDFKPIRNLSQQSNYVYNQYPSSISNYQQKLAFKQSQLLQFIQRQEKLKNQFYQNPKPRQFSQQQERQTFATKPRAFSIHQRDYINASSQPNLINDDSNCQIDHFQNEKGDYISNNFSIFQDISKKKQKILPPMNQVNQDPFLQTFGKQFEIVNKNRFPKEVFQGNVNKMRKKYQQNFYS